MRNSKYQLGLLGYPLSHSYSAILHETALKESGLEGKYDLYEISPLARAKGELEQRLIEVRQGKIQGLNVTIPYKQTVIPYLDDLSETARQIGAVNTICLKNGLLYGDNTDVEGFRRDFIRHFPHKKKGLVLGAGGAARAVLHVLKNEMEKIYLAARNPEKAAGLVNEFIHIPAGSTAGIIPIILDQQNLLDISCEVDLILNATPLGMLPEIQTSPWPPELPLPQNAGIYDLVYNPAKTRLMQQAEDSGLKAVNGLGMLLEQGLLAFSHWTGVTLPAESVEKEIIRRINNRNNKSEAI